MTDSRSYWLTFNDNYQLHDTRASESYSFLLHDFPIVVLSNEYSRHSCSSPLIPSVDFSNLLVTLLHELAVVDVTECVQRPNCLNCTMMVHLMQTQLPTSS
jgi:hypothetical protein